MACSDGLWPGPSWPRHTRSDREGAATAACGREEVRGPEGKRPSAGRRPCAGALGSRRGTDGLFVAGQGRGPATQRPLSRGRGSQAQALSRVEPDALRPLQRRTARGCRSGAVAWGSQGLEHVCLQSCRALSAGSVWPGPARGEAPRLVPLALHVGPWVALSVERWGHRGPGSRRWLQWQREGRRPHLLRAQMGRVGRAHSPHEGSEGAGSPSVRLRKATAPAAQRLS